MKDSGKIVKINNLKRAHSVPVNLTIDLNVEELNIDLSKPRLIAIKGKDNKGNEITWHLKVTHKGRLVLL